MRRRLTRRPQLDCTVACAAGPLCQFQATGCRCSVMTGCNVGFPLPQVASDRPRRTRGPRPINQVYRIAKDRAEAAKVHVILKRRIGTCDVEFDPLLLGEESTKTAGPEQNGGEQCGVDDSREAAALRRNWTGLQACLPI